MGRAVRASVICFLAALGCKERAPKSREERAADALARVDQIAAVMPEIRRLSLDRPIPAGRQSGTDLRLAVGGALAEEPHLDHRQLALQSLGLLDTTTDLARSIEDVYASQAAAYYDPHSKKFSLVMAPASENAFDSITSHELTHGLQDQHFDLTTYLAGTKETRLNADEQIARRFVVEGDAMFASVIYIAYTVTNEKELTGEQVSVVRRELAKLEDLNGADLAASLTSTMSTAKIVDPEISKAIEAMPTIPAAILDPFLMPYMKGTPMIAEIYQRGGWDAVNKLYKDPPRSTAQVLHPGEQLLGPRREPRTVALPTRDALHIEALDEDVLGELMWGVYFRRWKHSGDAHPEQGWTGDRYAVWRDDKGKILVLVSTVWNSDVQAKAFYDAYVSTLDTRYPERSPGRGEQVRDRVWVRLAGDRVFIADGTAQDFMPLLERVATRIR